LIFGQRVDVAFVANIVQRELTATLSKKQWLTVQAESRDLYWSARFLIFLGVALYLLWFPIMRFSVPNGVDPFYERALVGMACLCFVVASFSRYLRWFLPYMVTACVYIASLHILSLVVRNDFAVPYVVSFFIVVGSTSTMFMTVSGIGIFAGLTSAGAAVAVAASDADPGVRLQFVLGTVTLLGVMTLSVWRHASAQAAVRSEMKRVGRLF
jgi:hypothetical protein